MWLVVNLEELLAQTSAKKIGARIFLAILCIYPFIAFFQYKDFCQHKNQVVVEQTVCEGFTWNDDNSYYKGVDYLNFSIDVSFKDVEVSGFDVHTVVFHGDKYVGYIQSHFSGTSERVEGNIHRNYFETNTKQKLYFHISHPTDTSWQGYELFKELYDGNISEFRFVSNIICVNFTDGTIVGRHLSTLDFYYDENGVLCYKDIDGDGTKYYFYDKNGKKQYVENESN